MRIQCRISGWVIHVLFDGSIAFARSLVRGESGVLYYITDWIACITSSEQNRPSEPEKISPAKSACVYQCRSQLARTGHSAH